MEERIYLSQVIEVEKLKKGQANIVVAPCHSGKTTVAKEKISSLATCPEKVLFLIDTRAGKESLIKEEGMHEYSEEWGQFMANYNVNMEWNGIMTVEDMKMYAGWSGEGMRVMTYHQFGYKLKEHPNLLEGIEVIICDEMHNLIKYRNIERVKRSGGTEDTPCNDALREIMRAVNQTENVPLVVIMTATVNPVSVILDEHNIPVEYFYYYGKVDEDKTAETQYYGNLRAVLDSIESGQKTIVFIPHIKQMEEYSQIVKDKGYEVCCLWGLNNDQYIMDAEQLSVRSKILRTQNIPDDIDVLFINAAYETSINIRNKEFKTMVIHSGSYDTRVQVRGRLRHDIDKMYIYDPEHENISCYFPDEYCDKELTVEERQEVVDLLDLRDEKGRKVGWRGIVEKLEADDCIVSYLKKGQRRYCVVHKNGKI